MKSYSIPPKIVHSNNYKYQSLDNTLPRLRLLRRIFDKLSRVFAVLCGLHKGHAFSCTQPCEDDWEVSAPMEAPLARVQYEEFSLVPRFASVAGHCQCPCTVYCQCLPFALVAAMYLISLSLSDSDRVSEKQAADPFQRTQQRLFHERLRLGRQSIQLYQTL